MADAKTLNGLTREAEGRFCAGKPSPDPCPRYLFTLGKFPGGWMFRVVDDWSRWMAAGLRYEFGRWPTPEEAVREFLEYVRKNRIDVGGLQR